MSIRDGASMGGADTALLREPKERMFPEVHFEEPEVKKRWHPGTTLAFIVVSCTLLWAGIIAAFSFLF